MSAAVSLPGPFAAERPKRTSHRWREREDAILCMGWGIQPIAQVAATLGRSPIAVYQRAVLLGLGAGCPQGFEYLNEASRRVGFHLSTLQKILRWANVFVRLPAAKPGSKNKARIVEPHAVDAAVARWLACETLQQAARRTGYDDCTLRRHLKAAAARGDVTLEEHVGGRHWRIPRNVVDKVVGSLLAREDGLHAARRIGVSWNTLKKWLREAGIERPASRQWLVDAEAIERIVAVKRAAGSRAFRGTKSTEGETTT